MICRLLVRHYGQLIAFGAGWTDPERQRPVGDTRRHEPAHADAITEAELDRALGDPDPLRGIAQLTARLVAAFVLDRAGSRAPSRSEPNARRAPSAMHSLAGRPAARRRVAVRAPDALPGTRRAQPRCVRDRRPGRNLGRPRRPPLAVQPRRPRAARSRAPRRLIRCAEPEPSLDHHRVVERRSRPVEAFSLRLSGRSSTSGKVEQPALFLTGETDMPLHAGRIDGRLRDQPSSQ